MRTMERAFSHSAKWVWVLVMAAMLLPAGVARAQTAIRQAGNFEAGNPNITVCLSTVDFGPTHGSTVTAAAGSTFLGFHETMPNYAPEEVFSIAIDRTLSPGSSYVYPFVARIAPIDPNTAPLWGPALSNGGANSGTFTVHAGATPCAQTQLIGTMALTWPADNQWNPHELSFVASGNYQYFTFAAAVNSAPDNITYFGVDDAPPTDVAITKTDGSATYTPGTNVTYTIVATNNGPNYASSVQISDPLPAGIISASWTCSASGGAVCGAANGVGAITTVANMPVNTSVTYTLTMAVPSTMTGPLTNVATVAPPAGGDGDPSNNTAQDVDTALTAQAPLVSCTPAEVRATERYWFFGVNGGIDFGVSGTTATPVLGAQTAHEGTTVVTDTSGQLLFWSNGGTVFNRNHAPMPNGSGLLGHSSTVQTVAAFPSLTRQGVYFVVATSGAIENGSVGELYYSEVDMSLDGGLGDVTAVKNVQLGAIGAASEALIAVPTSDGTGFWVLTPTYGTPLINAYRFDGNGPVTGTAVVSTMSTPNGSSGTLNFSADLTQLVQITPLTQALTYMRLLTFDADSGAVGERFTWQLPNQAGSFGYSADFSPSGDYVYAVRIWNGARLYRYRVAGATTAAEVDATREDLGIFGPNGGQVRRGSDGRMYVASTGSASLSIVNDPDNPVDPGFVVNGFPLAAGAGSRWGLPQLVTGCPIPLDYSDAPASYGIAQHTATGPQLGAVRDGDFVPATSPDATGDDVTGTDDEDGLQTIIVRQGTTTASAAVTAINPLASPVTLAGWIDFDGNGSFDAGERAEIAVPANTTAATPFTLIWSGLPPVPLATGAVTFARFRIGATVGELATPDGTATSGEVEDYQVTVDAQANLRVTKTSTPNPYIPGAPLTYTVVYTNDGPSPVVGAQVQDEVPAALRNVTWTCAASGGTCPAPSGTGGFAASINIGSGGTVTFTITGDVPTGLQGVLLNTATILPPPGVTDPDPNNNSAVDPNPATAIPTGPADLQITQLFPGVAQPNGLLTFTLVTRNLGSNVALNPYITGMIPPGTTFVSVGTSAGGTCLLPDDPAAPDPATGYPIGGAAAAPLRCTWPGLMNPGESHTMTFTVRVAPGTPTGQILWSCWWTWSETEDPYHANNVVDAYLFVDDGLTPVGDLAIQAGALSEGVVATSLPTRVGTPVPMRFWVTNHGPAASRGQYALILDTANTIEIVDVQLPQGWVSPSGPASAVWDTGPIAPGQTVALDLTVRVLTPGAMELFAQRIAGLPGDPNASNERAAIILDGYAPGAAGRWVAVGNVDGVGAGEILTGAGQGETPQVRLFTGAGADTGVRFYAYERPFTGGVQIASCDVDGDGIDELITAPGPGRASTIRVLGLGGGVVTELMAFDAFEASFTGGASVACADLDADGVAELIVGAGPGRAPEVQVYNVGLSSLSLRATFLAYEAGFLGGVRVAAGAYPGRAGWLDAFSIVTTPGAGRAPELRLWTATGAPVAQVVVSSATNGVLPTLGDVNGDGQLDLLLAPDDGRPELIRIFEIDSGEVLGDIPGNLPGFPVGIRTAVGVLGGGPGQPEIVIGNGPGGHPRVRVIYWLPTGPVQRLEIVPLEIP